ncbi:hypothetical protein SUBG_00014 [Sulfitobacter phage pCB2047-C]|uniref:hypothetical protein n=1 Tax=Sulfitobacter phage pCB2047-C TaxID=754043 RepID=UPI0002C0EF81|nr:hypothetical protein SUBG_00014 [Sulfitobacter phage pCB2047-C]YP_007675460.1 hypothetical protein SUAG_00068 [Sulfitobacter phage pCB2047-A]PTB00017.1 hypothetical protein C8254_14185 [Sulfitobacter sp. CB-A]ULO21693.1 hypothetical protein IV89_001240 [Sulfitobacter sp. CB2047]AGG91185.1 hypothetical protein SUBG_00014 [Sulfitobacter phage pCB2047-C]AGH30794.1 hypothetical protein SUAG_00068 [Sulfitobacter phage pCB2047-A]
MDGVGGQWVSKRTVYADWAEFDNDARIHPAGTYLIVRGYGHYITTEAGETFETTVGNKVIVQKEGDGAYHTRAFGPPSGTDDTAKIQALLALSSGGKIVFDYFVGSYFVGLLLPGANTHIVLMPGVTLEGISGGSRVFQIQKENIVLEGYGATLKRNPMQTSHVVYINASTSNWARHIRIRGLKIVGNGASGTGGTGENDCIYVGGSPQGVGGNPALDAIPEDVIIEDCECISPRRNVISIVAGDNVTVRNNDLDGTGAVVLQCGVDIEANTYMTDGSSAVKRIKVHDNRLRNCAGINLAVVFGDDVEFFGNDMEITDPTASGIGGGAGGAQFNDNVYREGDRLGATAFDQATGVITVRVSGDTTLHELGIHEGMWVQGSVKLSSGATFPVGMDSPYRYVISWISDDGLQMRVSTGEGYGEITSFSGAETGTLDNDPTVSDLSFLVFREGQCSNIKARDNKINYVGVSGAFDAFNISTCYNWELSNNSVEMGLSTGQQIRATFGYGLTINGGYGRGGIRGLSAGAFSAVSATNHTVKETTLDAYSLTGPFVLSGCKAIACLGDIIDSSNATGALVRKFKAVKGTSSSSFGIKIAAGDRPRIEYSDFSGAGSSAVTSVSLGPSVTNASVVQSKVFGGVIFAAGSKLYNPASLADGEGVSTTVSAPGASFGMPVDVTFPVNLQGVQVTAWVQGSNVIGVRFQNETGAAVDLAEATLSVACR